MQGKQQFHIIIGEDHLQSIAIDTAIELLALFKAENPTLCLENSHNKDTAKMFAESQKKVFLSNKLAKRANNNQSFSTLVNLVLRYSPSTKMNDVHKSIMLNLIGRNRILAFDKMYKYCQTNSIEMIGIDTKVLSSDSRINGKTEKDRLDEMKIIRSEHMRTELLKCHQDGKSTITVVGKSHLIDLITSMAGVQNCYFFSVSYPTPVDFSCFHPSIGQFFDGNPANSLNNNLIAGHQEVDNALLGKYENFSSITEGSPVILGKKIYLVTFYDLKNFSIPKLGEGLIKSVSSEFNVREFLALNADVNFQSSIDGKTALHHAMENRYVQSIQALLESGAKIDIPCKNNETVLAFVKSNIAFFKDDAQCKRIREIGAEKFSKECGDIGCRLM